MKLFSIFIFVLFSVVAQSATAGLFTGPRYEYRVNERGETIQVRVETTRGRGNGLCGRNEMWSTARHLCMSPTGTKFLYVDSSTGYMEVDLANCGRPGMFATVSQAVLTAVIQAAAVEAIENPYAAYGAAGVANSFVGAVSQNRLGKKCSIPAQLADANNFSEMVRKNLIREQLKAQQEQLGLENQVRQEMGLQLAGTSQQPVSAPKQFTSEQCETFANQKFVDKGGFGYISGICSRSGFSGYGPTVKGGQQGCGCR